MSTLGYVVIEFNQASSQPDPTPYSDLHWDIDAAKEALEDVRKRTANVGRRETYQLAEVVLLDAEDYA